MQITAVAASGIEVYAIELDKLLSKAGAPLVSALRNDAAFKQTYYHARWGLGHDNRLFLHPFIWSRAVRLNGLACCCLAWTCFCNTGFCSTQLLTPCLAHNNQLHDTEVLVAGSTSQAGFDRTG